MKRNSLTFYLQITICGLLFVTGQSYGGMAPAGVPTPPVNDADFSKMMQDLEKATQEMDTFIKSLPPEEQEEFNRVVQIVEKKMQDTDPAVLEKFLTNQMSPEEMDQFLGNVFEGIETGKEEEKAPQVEEKKPVKEKKKKEKPVKKVVSAQDQAIELVNSVVKSTDSVLVKVQAVPELPLKLKRWGKQGKIYDWPKDGSWDNVKKEIESLRNDINKLLDKEPGKDKYKYLDAFIQNDTLYKQITKLNTTLAEYEPKIETTGVGIDKISKETKTAIKRAVSSFTENIYRLQVPQELKKVFDQFEPKATKLREKEEEAKKKPNQKQKNPESQPQQ